MPFFVYLIHHFQRSHSANSLRGRQGRTQKCVGGGARKCLFANFKGQGEDFFEINILLWLKMTFYVFSARIGALPMCTIVVGGVEMLVMLIADCSLIKIRGFQVVSVILFVIEQHANELKRDASIASDQQACSKLPIMSCSLARNYFRLKKKNACGLPNNELS